MVPDSDYRIKLQVFEGPLDLLLFLIRKNELDIYDIPIESVTRQYLEAIRAMQQLDLDVAGEFFVMAATLMEIKSRMLLPKGLHAIDPNAEEEEVDPRWELVHQLLQYKKFKEAAAKLTELSETRQNLMERYIAALNEPVERPLKSVDRIELWNSFNIVLRRLAEKLVVGEIHDEVVTVSDQMEWILERTKTEKSFIFSHLFPEGLTLRRLVATFLAVLELTRLKRLRVRQSEAFADIVVEAVEATPPAPEAPVETPATEEPVAPVAPVKEGAIAMAVVPSVLGASELEAAPESAPAASETPSTPSEAPAETPTLASPEQQTGTVPSEPETFAESSASETTSAPEPENPVASTDAGTSAPATEATPVTPTIEATPESVEPQPPAASLTAEEPALSAPAGEDQHEIALPPAPASSGAETEIPLETKPSAPTVNP